jgi:hypothetical protein
MITEISGTPICRHFSVDRAIASDCPRSSAPLPGIGAGRVDERDHRQAEPVGQVHQAHRLAVALGSCHAEIPLDPGGRVVALLVPDHDDRRVVEPCQPAHDRVVVGEVPVTGQRREFREKRIDVV